MRTEQDLIDEVIEHLINLQLKPYNVTIDDIRNVDNWYLNYTQTLQEQEEFIEYATNYIASKLKMSKKMAKKEAGWFILNWGLKIKEEESETIKLK